MDHPPHSNILLGFDRMGRKGFERFSWEIQVCFQLQTGGNVLLLICLCLTSSQPKSSLQFAVLGQSKSLVILRTLSPPSYFLSQFELLQLILTYMKFERKCMIGKYWPLFNLKRTSHSRTFGQISAIVYVIGLCVFVTKKGVFFTWFWPKAWKIHSSVNLS